MPPSVNTSYIQTPYTLFNSTPSIHHDSHVDTKGLLNLMKSSSNVVGFALSKPNTCVTLKSVTLSLVKHLFTSKKSYTRQKNCPKRRIVLLVNATV